MKLVEICPFQIKSEALASKKIIERIKKNTVRDRAILNLSEELEIESILLKGNLILDNELVYKKAFSLFGKEKVVFLGQNHAISYPLVRSFFDYVQNKGSEPVLIIFDSFLDLPKFPKKISSYEDWLKKLIEDGFPIENILIVGVRDNYSSEIKAFGKKIRKVTVEDLMFDLENKTDAIMEFASKRDLYLSIDISCVDGAFAPGVDFCEPGGISSREILYIFKRMNKIKKILGIDLVGINPLNDLNEMTSQLGMKIISKFN